VGKTMDEKKLIVFCCENSALPAAEGLEDSSILADVKLVRLPCLGKVEVGLVLKCLEKGHPGVLMAGCPQDNCTHLTGSARAAGRITTIRQALREAGLPESLVRLEYLSSLDTRKFEQAVRAMMAELTASRSVS
jgi:F420-non-reducing hydrogenase iron-sulfur subunit